MLMYRCEISTSVTAWANPLSLIGLLAEEFGLFHYRWARQKAPPAHGRTGKFVLSAGVNLPDAIAIIRI